MDSKHINLIKENMQSLVEKTCNLDQVLEKLADPEFKVLNHYMVKYITKHLDRRKQITEFYTMMTCRGPDAFIKLIAALLKTGNEDAAHVLELSKVSLFSTNIPEINRNIQTTVDDFTDYYDEKDLIVEVHPERKFMDIAENSPSGKKTYTMKSRPRGLALIINIFKDPDPNRNRKGSHIDAGKVDKLFTDIGYETICHSDLKAYDMKKEIQRFSMNPRLLQVDSLVVFIMCHGKQLPDTEEVSLAAADGQYLTTMWITSQFSSQNSSFVRFEDKPKLFFFQACREEPKEPRESVNNLRLGNNNNTVVVFSTNTGDVSNRDTEKGTWFVNEFCRVVAENAYRYDLDTMLDMVNEAVEKKNSRFGVRRPQRMEVRKLGISGKIYFNPGL